MTVEIARDLNLAKRKNCQLRLRVLVSSPGFNITILKH